MNQNQKTSPLSVFRYLRNFCGISMEALAEAVGVSYLTVFNMEHNGNMKLSNLRKLAEYYRVSLDCLAKNDMAAAAAQMFTPAIRKNHQKTLQREKDRKCDEIGDRGERIAIELERTRLAGTPFATAVNGNVSEDVTAGFDVLSFEATGVPVYIEVKTTVGDKDTPFYLSRGELNFLKSCIDNGWLYRVFRLYHLNERDQCELLVLSAEELLRDYELIPVSYQVRRRAV